MPIEIYMEDLILGVILQYMVCASFSCFLMVGNGLSLAIGDSGGTTCRNI